MRRTVWILALAAGYLDGLALLYLGGVFASVVTGNLLIVGVTAATDPHHLTGTAARAALAVAVYAATVYAARNTPPARCLIAELAALCTLTGGWVATRHDPHGPAQLPLLTLAAIAMALQAAAQRDGDTPTGHLTGPLIRLAQGKTPLATGAPLIAMPAGAAAAALLLDHTPWLGPLPAVALVAAAIVTATVPPRRRRARTPATTPPEPAWTPSTR